MTSVLVQGQWWIDIFHRNSYFQSNAQQTSLTNQNSIQEEIKSEWKSGNACYHSLPNLLSSSLLSKNLKIKIYRTIILPGCDTWFLTLREERKLRVFENGVLRRIFGPKRDEVTEEWRKLCNEELNDILCGL
jgi:hypothetical protein